MKAIFLDTNIFLHFRTFDEIDWLSEATCTECEIVFSPFVIDELDKKKTGTSKVSNRARAALQKIEKFIEANKFEIQRDVRVTILTHKPTKVFCDEHQLNYDEPDQKILASMIDYRIKNPSASIVLCSDDIGPRLRAKTFQIDVLKLSDGNRLASDESENEKKVKKLEQEILILKSKIPKLKLEFGDGLQRIELKRKKSSNYSKDDFVKTNLLKIKDELPYLEILNPKSSEGNKLSVISMHLSALSQEQVDGYNTDLDNYFEEVEGYLNALFDFERQRELSYLLEILIQNEGTVPGEEIDVHLHFPDGFDLMEPEDLIKKPQKPEPPYRPKHRMDFASHLINSASFFSHPQVFPTPEINFNKPSIKKTNSYDVNMFAKYVKHLYSVKLDELVMVYERDENVKSFQIDYEITAANMPERVSGHLNVIFA